MITLDTIKQAIKAAVEPLRARARGMVRRAVLRALDNDGGLAKVQVELTEDELADGVELLSWPGISIRPDGCEAIVLSIGGNPSNLIAIPNQRGKRLTGADLAPGEVALHIGVSGQMVRLKNNGDIILEVAVGRKIYLGVDGATHPFALADSVDARFAALVSKLNSHKHFPVGLLDSMGLPVTGSTDVPAPPGFFPNIASVASDTIFGVS